MLEDSVGSGESGGTSTERNSPLLSRSARTIGVMPPPKAVSPAKGTMATGIRCAPAPVISMESCAWAVGARAGTNDNRTTRAKLERPDRKRHPPDLVLGKLSIGPAAGNEVPAAAQIGSPARVWAGART